MKGIDTTRLLVSVSMVNTVALVWIGLGINGVNAIDLLKSLKNTDSTIKSAMVSDRVWEGEIITSYSNTEEGSVVTIVEIESAMQQIGEITTVAYEYSGIAVDNDCCRLCDWEVGFTRNSVSVEYEGTIRAGYVIEDIGFDVDHNNRTIAVTLPEVEVFSNEITSQNIDWEDNFLNHIDPDVSAELLAEAREEELDEAIDDGLFQEAEESAQNVIRATLTELCDYEIVFTHNDVVTLDHLQKEG